MKRITFSILSVLVLIGAGCERHPASELEPEEGEPHAAEPAKSAETAAPAETTLAAKAEEAAKAGPAPKYFSDFAK